MRIYNGYSEPLDFCIDCFPDTEEWAFELYGKGEGPDGRGNCFAYDADHPDYEGEEYVCEDCGKPLSCLDE